MMHWGVRGAFASAGGGIAGVVLGWLFGLPELSVLSVAAMAALLGSGLWLSRDLQPDVTLAMHPATVQLDDACTLVVRVNNPHRRATAPTRVHGRLGTAGDGILAFTRLEQGRTTELSVNMPTPRRGIVHVDDLHSTVTDPLGWWARTSPARAHATLIIRPRVHPLGVHNLGVGLYRSATGARGRGPGGSAEDELVGLRPYVRGDDLRLIHWRTSARRMHPHVVQVEPPAHSAAVVVVLDNRTEAQGVEEFEQAVQAGASVAVHFAAQGHPVRLLTGDGWDSGALDPDRAGDLLDALAAVQRRHATNLERALLNAVEQEHAGVVLCTGASMPLVVPTGVEPERLVVVSCGGGSFKGAGRIVHWVPGASLQGCWDEARWSPPSDTPVSLPVARPAWGPRP